MIHRCFPHNIPRKLIGELWPCGMQINMMAIRRKSLREFPSTLLPTKSAFDQWTQLAWSKHSKYIKSPHLKLKYICIIQMCSDKCCTVFLRLSIILSSFLKPSFFSVKYFDFLLFDASEVQGSETVSIPVWGVYLLGLYNMWYPVSVLVILGWFKRRLR